MARTMGMAHPWVRFVRSAGAGTMASLVDLGTLCALVSLGGASPRVASVPALLLGNIVMFFAQKHLAFRSRGSARNEASRFILVQLGGIALNAALFELVMRAVPSATPYYAAVRILTTNAVWLAYSYPLWHLVFKVTAEPRHSPGHRLDRGPSPRLARAFGRTVR